MSQPDPVDAGDAIYLATIHDYGEVAKKWVSALREIDYQLASMGTVQTPVTLEIQLVIPYGPDPDSFKRGISVGRYFRNEGALIVQMTPYDHQEPGVDAVFELLNEALQAAEAALKRRGGPTPLRQLRELLEAVRNRTMDHQPQDQAPTATKQSRA